MKKIKLSKIVQSEIDKQKQMQVLGGTTACRCGCGCPCSSSEPSSSMNYSMNYSFDYNGAGISR